MRLAALLIAVSLTTVSAVPVLQVVTRSDAVNQRPPMVTVKNGTIRGIHNSAYDQDFFLGVPYAQPPLSGLRFANPVPINKTFRGTRDASRYSLECVGYGTDQLNYNVSEDCLYLNVVRPSGYDGKKLPVFVWVHGGGLYQGGSPDQRYNLSFIVRNSVKVGKPIVAVSFNYRLSAWGFSLAIN